MVNTIFVFNVYAFETENIIFTTKYNIFYIKLVVLILPGTFFHSFHDTITNILLRYKTLGFHNTIVKLFRYLTRNCENRKILSFNV